MPPSPPNANPQVHVIMDLNTFNRMQAVLSKQPFEEISELIFFFRNQVAEQLQTLQRQQAENAGQTGPRLNLVGDGEAGA